MSFAKRFSAGRFDAIRWLIGLAALVVALDVATFLVAEGLWFQGVGYERSFGVRVLVQGGLGLLTTFGSVLFLLFNLRLAGQRAWPDDLPERQKGTWPGQLGLSLLLPLVLLLAVLICAMVWSHGQLAVSRWQPSFGLSSSPAHLPMRFQVQTLWQVGLQLATQPSLAIAFLGGAIALVVWPRLLLGAIALVISLSFGVVLADHWTTVVSAFFATNFERVEPVFRHNLSLYIFRLPLLELLAFWWVGLGVLATLSVGLIYLLSGNSISSGRFRGFSAAQQRHLYGLGSGLMGAIALSHWLDRYNLLYSTTGAVYGASYTDVAVQAPGYALLSAGAGGLGLWMLGRWGGSLRSAPQANASQASAPQAGLTRRRDRWLVYGLIGYGVLWGVISGVLPVGVQQLIVQPNELQRETPYIQRAIALTREAFDLDLIDEETFDPAETLTYEDLQKNELTVENIRLWDTRPLLETNRQLQRIRPYYEFPGADIDRYTLSTDQGKTLQQQVLIAARELDYANVPAEAQTWINEHLIYTHGYGFTLSPVNQAGEGGLPDYFIRGVEMAVSSPSIRNSIPIGKPQIYYGELTNTYAMTQTTVRELDYPSGSDNVYNTYDGRGGVGIGSWWRRLIFAKHLRDWRMLLTDEFTPQTRLLFRRNVLNRVRAIAPFLRYDRDPYLVSVDIGQDIGANAAGDDVAPDLGSSVEPVNDAARLVPSPDHYLYWILDAYTTSDRYPYSDPLGNEFNYIRNSVKVVVDAYHGTVRFYVADDRDPIINTWRRIFPEMFQPLSAMPLPLQEHIRYPQDLFRAQSEHLMVYHMTDPQVFYNREDQWRAPNEVYADAEQVVGPYYLIMKLPSEEREEFILLLPYTPDQRTNLIAWLAARSDRITSTATRTNGLGKMLLYRFPKQNLVYGPEQLEARINQDPIISQQISLWNRRGSSAVQGNLLVIPIEQSLIYVEPLYLEATLNRLPTLARVIAAYGDRIAMAETLEQSLKALFAAQAPTETLPILRELDAEEPVP